MEDYEGDRMEVVVEPDLVDSEGESEDKLVMITHDEVTFYANDDNAKGWFMPGESHFRPKTPGLSVMISAFQCPCHGLMHDPGEDTRVSYTLFEAGSSREGYWTVDHLCKQLEDVIDIFKKLHPGCVGVFLFDQSSNHTAKAADALVVTRMTMGRKEYNAEKDKYKFRDGFYWCGDQRVRQSMYVEENGRTYFKGIDTILKERGIKPPKGGWLRKKGHSRCVIPLRSPKVEMQFCCPRHRLASEPDFVHQRPALQEIFNKNRCFYLLYPKFHCETNWIEPFWADVKRDLRARCKYTYQDLLDQLPDALEKASDLTKIRRYFRRCKRYIEAYSRGLDANEAENEVRQFMTTTYTSHRRLGVNQ